MYKIRCQVQGGITGYRTALLKKNGEIAEFETREEAQAEADRLTEKMLNNHTASFSYTVEEEF